MKTNASNVIDVLEAHHRDVAATFSELDRTQTGKRDVVTTLAQKLLAHIVVVQTIVYPAFARAAADAVRDGHEEHELARFALSRVLGTRSTDATFDAKVKALRDLVEHHFAGEACVTFAKARASIDEKTLFELGAEVATAFEAMVSSRPATLMRRAERVAHVARAS